MLPKEHTSCLHVFVVTSYFGGDGGWSGASRKAQDKMRGRLLKDNDSAYLIGLLWMT